MVRTLERFKNFGAKLEGQYGEHWEDIATKRRWWGIRASAVIEVLVFLLILTAVDFFFGSGNRFFFVYPHPAWVILLLVIVQYGTSEALLTALLLSLYLLLGNLPEQKVEQSIYGYLMMLSLRPILWFSAATFIGGLQERQIAERDELRHQVGSLEKQQKTLSESYEKLKEIKETLETKLVGQMRSASVAYEAIKGVEVLSPGQILMSIAEIVKRVVNPEKFSVFALGENGLEPLSCVGWNDKEKYQRRFAADSLLFQEIVVHKRPAAIFWPKDREYIGREGLVAAPLIEPTSRTVFGMIKIEEMAFEEFSLSTVDTIRVLCEWVGSAYGAAVKFEEAKENAVLNQDNQLLSYGFFKWQTRLLKNMSKEMGIPFIVIYISVKHAVGTSTEDKKQLSTFLSNILVSVLPQAVGIYDGKRMFRDFGIIAHLKQGETLDTALSTLQNNLNKQAMFEKHEFNVRAELLYEGKKH